MSEPRFAKNIKLIGKGEAVAGVGLASAAIGAYLANLINKSKEKKIKNAAGYQPVSLNLYDFNGRGKKNMAKFLKEHSKYVHDGGKPVVDQMRIKLISPKQVQKMQKQADDLGSIGIMEKEASPLFPLATSALNSRTAKRSFPTELVYDFYAGKNVNKKTRRKDLKEINNSPAPFVGGLVGYAGGLLFGKKMMKRMLDNTLPIDAIMNKDVINRKRVAILAAPFAASLLGALAGAHVSTAKAGITKRLERTTNNE